MTQDPRFPNLFILNHPLIQHKLTHMRDKDTSTRTFRELLREITLLMGYEITRNLPLTTRHIETPMGPMDAPSSPAASWRWCRCCGRAWA